jgi:hypothetical protein
VEELVTLGAYTLAQEPRCGERARRVLEGSRGSATASVRWRLGQRVREDAVLAHAERRAPHPRDFPTPTDLTAEERAVYRAAASGYLVLFGDVPAIAVDVARRAELEGLGVELAARPGLFVDTDDGIELRMLRMSGTTPHIADGPRHAAALVIAAELMPVRVIAADLLSLETTTGTITADDAEPAREWARARVEAWREAVGRPAVNHAGCRACEFIWNCPIHAKGVA